MQPLIDIITYCPDTTGLADWFRANRPDHITELDEGIKLDVTMIDTRYRDGGSLSIIRAPESVIAEATEETTAGWLLETPLQIFATGRSGRSHWEDGVFINEDPWYKLTPEQVALCLEVEPWQTDEDGNDIITEIYRPFQFTI